MVQVERDVLDGIDVLAKGMRRPKAWMAAELLIEAAKRRERYGEWVLFRSLSILGKRRRKRIWAFLGGDNPRPRTRDMVYQQVFVSPGTVERIDELAETLGRTRAEMCSDLLTCAFEDEKLLIEIVTSDLLRKAWNIFKLPRGEQARGNREENRKRREDE
jgi:predicted transcriptional regulator